MSKRMIETVWSNIHLTQFGPVVTATVFRKGNDGKISRRNYSSKGLAVTEQRRAVRTARIVTLLEGVHKRQIAA